MYASVHAGNCVVYYAPGASSTLGAQGQRVRGRVCFVLLCESFVCVWAHVFTRSELDSGRRGSVFCVLCFCVRVVCVRMGACVYQERAEQWAAGQGQQLGQEVGARPA